MVITVGSSTCDYTQLHHSHASSRGASLHHLLREQLSFYLADICDAVSRSREYGDAFIYGIILISESEKRIFGQIMSFLFLFFRFRMCSLQGILVAFVYRWEICTYNFITVFAVVSVVIKVAITDSFISLPIESIIKTNG